MYNSYSLTKTDLVQVPLVGAEQVAEKRFFSQRGFVVSLTILAITLSLASRTVHEGFYGKPTAHSASAISKIQHRDKDACEWVTPVAAFSLLSVAEPSIARASTEGIFVELQYNALYNRPPPLS